MNSKRAVKRAVVLTHLFEITTQYLHRSGSYSEPAWFRANVAIWFIS